MVLSVLTYNASSGSDTAASGAGPSTAITGSSATNGAGNIVNLDGTPDLSGVAVNDIFWASVAGANRNLSRITAVDDTGKTVTTEDLMVLTGGESWAIGGKRKTLEANTSKKDWEDAKAGWRFLPDVGVYTITEGINPQAGNVTDGPVEFVAADPDNRPTFDITTNINTFDFGTTASRVIIDGILFTRSSGAGSFYCIKCGVNEVRIEVRNSDLDCAGMAGGILVQNATHGIIEFNDIYDADQGTKQCIRVQGGRNEIKIVYNGLHDADMAVYLGNMSSFSFVEIGFNTVYDIGVDGFNVVDFVDSDHAAISIYNNSMDGTGSTGSGVDANNATVDDETIIYFNDNILSNWGAYGADFSAEAAAVVASNHHILYFSNTSGDRNNLAAGTDDVTGSDPLFTSLTDGSEDLTPSSGSPAIDAGSPVFKGPGSTTNRMDIGAVQSAAQAGGGAGGLLVHPGMSGGMHG